MRALTSFAWQLPASNRYVDRVTGVCLAVLYMWFAYRHLAAFYVTGAPLYLLYTAMESFVVLLALFRQPAQKKHVAVGPLSAALAGTFLPLTLSPAGTVVAPQLGFFVSLAGAILAVTAYSSLNTKFGVAPAVRGVAQRGAYAFIRHPMYGSYFLVLGGYLLTSFSVANALSTCAALTAQVVRIRYEEALLLSDERYRTYAQRVRWRLVPGVY